MNGIILAWLAGEGMVIYRSMKTNHRPPMPGQLMGSSAVFLVCGLLASAPGAGFLGAALAWGFDIALFMNLAPDILSGATKTVAADSKA